MCEWGFIQNNIRCRTTMGHLGQFNKIRCDLSLHKVLSNYISAFGILFVDAQCVFGVQTHILNSPNANISCCGVFWYFGTFCFFCLPFLPFFGGRYSLKKKKSEECMWHDSYMCVTPLYMTVHVWHMWTNCHTYESDCTRPTQSIMCVPLQVNRFQKSILLIVQYKCLISCS